MLKTLDKNRISELLETGGSGLLEEADRVRTEYCGDRVFIRGLLEFSNNCENNCLYCGLRSSNRKLKRYRMPDEEILAACIDMLDSGLKTIVLQSGEDPFYTQERLCRLVKNIKKVKSGAALTLSIGERPLDEYAAFRSAGADRFLLRHETASSGLYARMHPGQSMSRRLECLRGLKKQGWQTGCGGIIGLPGQTADDLAEDILFAQNFQPDMVGAGPFIPAENTPLSGEPAPPLNRVLRMLALYRITTKDAHIPATTAMASLYGEMGYREGLKAGCNVIMAGFTPPARRRHYRIYDNRAVTGIDAIRNLVEKTGRILSFERGDSLKKPGPGNQVFL